MIIAELDIDSKGGSSKSDQKANNDLNSSNGMPLSSKDNGYKGAKNIKFNAISHMIDKVYIYILHTL